jgi:hypothetical protein
LFIIRRTKEKEHADRILAIQGQGESQEENPDGRQCDQSTRHLQRHGRHTEKNQFTGYSGPFAGGKVEFHHRPREHETGHRGRTGRGMSLFAQATPRVNRRQQANMPEQQKPNRNVTKVAVLKEIMLDKDGFLN